MALGGAGGAADSVPAGPSAQQNHHIAGLGPLPDYIFRQDRRHHRAAFQPLGYIALVVNFRHVARGKADLVAVGGIARRRGLGQLALGQLASQRIHQRLAGVPAAGDPHGLMDIRPPGKRVPDAAADAGGRAAEGLDLRGVVVGLVFEHQQPVLLLTVHHGGNVDGTGVDLLALVQLRQQAPLLQDLCPQRGNIHQGLRALFRRLRAVNLLPERQIMLVGGLHGVIPDVHAVNMGRKGGMAAVVGPIGIHHPQLRNGGIPVFFIPEVALQQLQVLQIHGKSQPLQQRGKPGFLQSDEACFRFYGIRLLMPDR